MDLRSSACTFGLLTICASLAPQPANGQGASAKDVFKKAGPALMVVVALDANGQQRSLGSGFYTKDDLVVTNLHVVRRARSIRVTGALDHKERKVKGIYAISKEHDIAILTMLDAGAPLLSASMKLETGDSVFALGNPRGLEATLSAGIVSSIRKLEGSSQYQITAPISPGSSGGPVLNDRIEVVGIATSYLSGGQNLNFAVDVKHLIDLIASNVSGTVASVDTLTGGPIVGLPAATFELDDEGWTVLGQGADAGIDHGPGAAHSGVGALKFAYKVEKGESGVLLLPTPNGGLAKAMSFHFWVKADANIPVIFSLVEKSGARYNTMFTSPKDKWQEVSLSVDDFVLSTGKDDPKDGNGKLDVEEIEHIGFADFAQFLAQSDNEQLTNLLGLKTGPRSFLLDDFVVSSAPVAAAVGAVGSPLDSFLQPQIGWFSLGAQDLQKSTGAPLGTAAIRVNYEQAAGKVAAIGRAIGQGKLAGAKGLQLSVSSIKPVKLIVQVEEVGGGKYNTTLDLAGSSKAELLDLKFSDFGAADDSTDTNGKLDPEAIFQFVLIDISGVLGTAGEGPNTLWVGKITATK